MRIGRLHRPPKRVAPDHAERSRVLDIGGHRSDQPEVRASWGDATGRGGHCTDYHGLLCPLGGPDWGPVRGCLAEVRFSRFSPGGAWRNARHVVVRCGGILSVDRRCRAGRRGDLAARNGRELEVSGPPTRRVRGSRGRWPCGAGTKRGRAVVEVDARDPGGKLRRRSGLAVAARYGRAAGVPASLSHDGHFCRTQPGGPHRLRDGSAGVGISIQRTATPPWVSGPGPGMRRGTRIVFPEQRVLFWA